MGFRVTLGFRDFSCVTYIGAYIMQLKSPEPTQSHTGARLGVCLGGGLQLKGTYFEARAHVPAVFDFRWSSR